jgi:hypothetical protein
VTARRGQGNRERPLRRRVATRSPKKTLLVFCEGEKTEPEYLNSLKRQPAVRNAAAVDLPVDTGHGGSVPLTLVSLAVDARSRSSDVDGETDEFWCVFDIEWPRNHPGLKDAIELRPRCRNLYAAQEQSGPARSGARKAAPAESGFISARQPFIRHAPPASCRRARHFASKATRMSGAWVWHGCHASNSNVTWV